MKLTPWFPGDVKPVRKGVYERRADWLGPDYSYWDGSSWGPLVGTPKQARNIIGYTSAWQNLPWRGVEK